MKLPYVLETGAMSEYEVKLAIAKKKYDNFEEIRKVQQPADMNLITKEEKEAKNKELAGQSTYNSMVRELFRWGSSFIIWKKNINYLMEICIAGYDI